jgi:dihydrolipoamide dehydrogenase
MKHIETEVVVIGAGPGGYPAAFYAADRGKKVILVEKDKTLGGACLNRGCIPSKALLHASMLLRDARESGKLGIDFQPPKIDLDKLRAWKNSVVEKLVGGVRALAQKRGVTVMDGRAYFEASDTLRVETKDGQKFVKFQKAIIAAGSEPALPKVFDLGNKRIMTSTEALELQDIPEDLLIVGGGYIGMELGTVYASLGSKIVMAEALPAILTGADPDLARLVRKYAETNFREVRVEAKVLKMATQKNKIKVVMEVGGQNKEELFDRVLVAVGRRPASEDLGLENTRVVRDEKGFIRVNSKLQTSDPSVYAVGDIAGGVLLAHKATREAKVAVDVLCGDENSMDHVVIPAVVYTDPELAWCGLTETEAKAKGIPVKSVRFPWAACGRALTLDRADGMTKLVLDPESERVLGVGIVGYGAGDLISEGVLAVEMGATARDLADTVHPHPTLSETVMESAEAFYGFATHTYNPKRPVAD